MPHHSEETSFNTVSVVENKSLLATYMILQRIMDIKSHLCKNWNENSYVKWIEFSSLIRIAKKRLLETTYLL